MTSLEEEARAEAAKFVREKHPEWHDVGVGIVQGSHYRSGFENGAAWWASRQPSEAEVETLTAEIHEAWEFQNGDCDHGEYRGGPFHGEPYEMCRLAAERIIRRRAARTARGERHG